MTKLRMATHYVTGEPVVEVYMGWELIGTICAGQDDGTVRLVSKYPIEPVLDRTPPNALNVAIKYRKDE